MKRFRDATDGCLNLSTLLDRILIPEICKGAAVIATKLIQNDQFFEGTIWEVLKEIAAGKDLPEPTLEVIRSIRDDLLCDVHQTQDPDVYMQCSTENGSIFMNRQWLFRLCFEESVVGEKALKKAKLLLVVKILRALQHRATRLFFNITSASASTSTTMTDKMTCQGLPWTPVGTRSRVAAGKVEGKACFDSGIAFEEKLLGGRLGHRHLHGEAPFNIQKIVLTINETSVTNVCTERWYTDEYVTKQLKRLEKGRWTGMHYTKSKPADTTSPVGHSKTVGLASVKPALILFRERGHEGGAPRGAEDTVLFVPGPCLRSSP